MNKCGICGKSINGKMWHIENENIDICEKCANEYFCFCEECKQLHRYNDLIEVYYGPNSWDYNLLCKNCLKHDVENGIVYWDENDKRYHTIKK